MAPTVLVVGEVLAELVMPAGARLGDVGQPSDAAPIARAGGPATALAWQLAETGLPVALAGRVGDDPFGHAVREALETAGIRACLAVDPANPTGTTAVLRDADGRETRLTEAGAAAFGPDPAVVAATGANHVHLTGGFLLRAGSRDTATALVSAARRDGATVSADAGGPELLEAVDAQHVLAALRETDLLLLTEPEALTLLEGLEPPLGQEDLLAPGCLRVLTRTVTEVVLTEGPESWRQAWEQHPRRAAWWAGRRDEPVPLDAALPAGVALSDGEALTSFRAGFLAAWVTRAPAAACLRAGAEAVARAARR